MKSVIWTATARDAIVRVLSPFGETHVVEDRAGLERVMADADVMILGNPRAYTADLARYLQKHAPALRWLQLTLAGYEGVALHGAPANVAVTNAGECWSPTVAEHAMAMLLALLRRLPQAAVAQASRRWDVSLRDDLASAEDLTLLVIGYGSIGREISRRAAGFGIKVVGMTRSGNAAVPADEMVSIAALAPTLARADAVILATPLTQETRHLINETTLAAMKPGAVLVNIARGGVIDTAALDASLRQGHLGGAALDVTEPEPLPPEHPLWTAPNLIITPHVAGFGSPALARRIATLIGDNAARYAAGQPLQHRVTVPILPS